MKISKSASRYAQALLDLAIEQNKLDAVAADMKYMATVCAENPELELMLQSPVVKADKKLSVLNAVFDQFDQLTNLFVDLIVKNGREAYLSQIASSFDVLLKAHLGIVPVTLISAQKLDDKVKKEIVSKVHSQNKKISIVHCPANKTIADLIQSSKADFINTSDAIQMAGFLEAKTK